MPAAVALGQRALPDQARQDLFDEEREALCALRDQRLDRGWQVIGADAGQRHAGHRRRIQAAQRQHGRRPAPLQRAGQSRRCSAVFVAQGAHTQHPFRGQVVGQVFQQGQRFPVRPVQVFQHQQAPGLGGQRAEQPQHRLPQEHE